MQLATNHVGHWLLTCLLMPKLIKAAEGKPKGSVRIVNITSASPMSSSMRWSDMNFDKKNKDLPQEEQPVYDLFKLWGYNNAEDVPYIPLDGYDRSKVANVLFSIGANKRLFERYGILSVAAHPGVIMTTELPRNFPQETIEAATKLCEAGLYTTKSVGAGASTGLVAALDPKLAVGVGETHEESENYGSYLAECQISEKARSLAVSSSEAEKLWRFSEKVTGEDLQW
jgi:NAD(P)-dependent dehydrogenase (short-subunit alcohol dehydrogenase family)